MVLPQQLRIISLVEGATEATIFLNAYTNYVDYKELAAEAPLPEFSPLEEKGL
jgi:hypothetical protein